MSLSRLDPGTPYFPTLLPTSRQTGSCEWAPGGPGSFHSFSAPPRRTPRRRSRTLPGHGKHDSHRPSLGFPPLRRSKTRAATCIGIASPDYVAPSGFLNLLTRSSAHAPSALFHADAVPGVPALRGFPLPVAATTFAALYPRVRSFVSLSRRSLSSDPRTRAPGRSVLDGTVLPASAGRSSLSFLPLRGFHPEP